MINNQDLISLNKYTLISNLINDKYLEKLFNEYNEKLLKKRFDNAYELSVNENILTIDTLGLSTKEIIDIIKNFLEKADVKNFMKNRSIYELVKISNIPTFRLEKIITKKDNDLLYEKINRILIESKYLSVDFLLLRCADNFVIKSKDNVIKNNYKILVKKILAKMISNKYLNEKKDNTSTILCWLDRIAYATVNFEINVKEFININKNILNTSFFHIDILWKCLNIINYISFSEGFYDSVVLRKFKRDILKKINNYYSLHEVNKEDTLETGICTLAKKDTSKEDYYHFFNMIKKLAENNEEDKIFAINLCEFTLYIDKKQNIFCYRFIRENFLTILNDLIKISDSIPLKERELHLLINMFYNSPFFEINKDEIYQNMLKIIQNFPLKKNKSLQRKYYKYCDILDYTLANNRSLEQGSILDKLTNNSKNREVLKQRFCLFFKNTI